MEHSVFQSNRKDDDLRLLRPLARRFLFARPRLVCETLWRQCFVLSGPHFLTFDSEIFTHITIVSMKIWHHHVCNYW